MRGVYKVKDDAVFGDEPERAWRGRGEGHKQTGRGGEGCSVKGEGILAAVAPHDGDIAGSICGVADVVGQVPAQAKRGAKERPNNKCRI